MKRSSSPTTRIGREGAVEKKTTYTFVQRDKRNNDKGVNLEEAKEVNAEITSQPWWRQRLRKPVLFRMLDKTTYTLEKNAAWEKSALF
ncbi:unnamed protein product [Soboliphyme baturini]|uniref:Uncharacterized protein n=1 Tax=Soboliphyme baturini TaxID=241478 RepID=A0A183IHI1_9BILA|nr:unnamed protein product [Soboliphyme baturini]